MKKIPLKTLSAILIINCFTMSLRSQERSLDSKMEQIRAELYGMAEYSHKEVKTAAYVESILKESSPDYLYTGIGGYGIIAGYKGRGKGPSLMFRCELDAIKTEDGYRHLCGHDGHMAILLGLADVVSANRDFNGIVWLLFQPAEEVGEGAALMVKDMERLGLRFDYSFSLHNKPGIPLNKVILHEGVYAAGSVGMEIHFKGSPSHASRPEQAKSPYRAIFESAEYMHILNNSKELFFDFILGTVVNITLGEINYGVTPGEGYLRMTLRSYADKDLEKLCSLMENFARECASKYKLQCNIAYYDRFPATLNNTQANQMVERALIAHSIDYEYSKLPERGSDDFAFFAFNSISSYFDIGNGTIMGDLHERGYKFSDQIMPIAVKIYSSIIYEKKSDD